MKKRGRTRKTKTKKGKYEAKTRATEEGNRKSGENNKKTLKKGGRSCD